MKRLGILVLLAGCGTASTADVDSFIQQLASEQCAWEFRCCKDAEIEELDGNKYHTEAECGPYQDLKLRANLYLHRLAATEGRLRVDGSQATACISQLQAKACNPKPGMTTTTNPMDMDECANVFVGTTPVGKECIYATECAKGAHCVADESAVGRGVCVPYQQDGDICNSDADCDPKVKNLYCSKADYHCHLRGTFGQPCAYTTDQNGKNPQLPLLLECDSTFGNLYCDPVSSTCKQLPADGDPCLYPLPPGVASQCNPDPALHLVCDHGTGTSASGGTCRGPAQVGQSCKSIACDTGLYCDTNLSTYVCKALPGFGQSCSTSGYKCAMPYFCNTSVSPYVCDQPASIGEDCVSPTRTCDTNAYCDTTITGTCQVKRADGVQCESSTQCISNLCGFDAVSETQSCQPRAITVACSGR